VEKVVSENLQEKEGESMGNYLNIGNDGFQAIRKGIYVDKTGLISFINETLGSRDKLTCISRPRRFGKSYAAQMLCAYYDRTCDSRALFADLEIAQDPSFEEHLNKYNVIYLDMTMFTSEVPDIRDVIPTIKARVLEELLETYPESPKNKTLCETLADIAERTGIKFVFIIDEWDVIFREAKGNTEVQKAYIMLLRTLFKGSLTDKTFAAAYITGILPIKKYGTQSAMTDFREYSMIHPKRLAKYVGFTEEEVQELCQKSGMPFEDMKHWYNGYSFDRVPAVYNPNSVMEAIKSERIGNYWTQTETYTSLQFYIDLDFEGIKEAIIQMLSGGSCKIDVGSFQNDMTSINSRDDVFTLLVHLGYLCYHADTKTVTIPNEEIRQEFVRALATGRRKEVAKLIQTSEWLLQETLDMNGDAVAEALQEAHNAGASPLFYNNEQALRSAIRFAYISCVDEYLRIEELPGGRGYADVVYLPKRGSKLPVMVVELKWNKPAESAIQQIKDRNYPQVLKDFGGDILLVGVSYDEKTKHHTCQIEKWSR
jgi:hypothetical protein